MDTNETAGVLAKVLAEVEKVSAGTHANAAELTELKVKSAMLEGQLAKAQGDLALVQEKASAELAIVKAALSETHGGPSGATDWVNESAKWVRGVYSEQKLRQPSTETFKNGDRVSDAINKVVTNFTTTTGASAGYLLPTLLRPGIIELQSVYGNLYPRVTRFNSPPGQSVTVNHRVGSSTMTWRVAQNVGMGQNDPNTHLYGTDTLIPSLAYVYEVVSNEMLTNPDINFGAVMLTDAVRAVNKGLEIALMSAASVPHAGITAAAYGLTTRASATLALLGAFVKEAIAANPWMGDTTRNKIFLHPRDAITLGLQAVSDSNLPGMLVWGDPRLGHPSTLFGYELIVHPSCAIGGVYSAVIGNPEDVILAEGPSYMADFSDQIKFAEFSTAMRVGNHYDFVVKQVGATGQWFKATITA